MKNARTPHGGPRRGAGRKRGGKNHTTLVRAHVEEAYRVFLQSSHRALWAAQLSRAMGLYVLVTKVGDGAYQVVTDERERERVLARRSERGRIWWLIEARPADAAMNCAINVRLMGVPAQAHRVQATHSLAELLASAAPDE